MATHQDTTARGRGSGSFPTAQGLEPREASQPEPAGSFPMMRMTHGAAFEARFGKLEVRAAVDPRFMLAIGVLVSGILLSIPPIIRAARERRARG